MAKLYFHYATMNAGKSAQLLQANHNYTSRGMRTIRLKTDIDHRGEKGEISSRIGLRAEATLFGETTDLLEIIASAQSQGKQPIACVFVDEAQFLTPSQVRQLARAVDRFNIPVMAYGLRTDFAGKLFPGSAAMLAMADEIREVTSICHCGRKATMMMRRGHDGKAVTEGDQVQIGDAEYQSLCRRHWAEATGL